MARTPASNDAFFREVDDEVRRERMERAARRYGVAIVAVLAAALIAFGAYLFWQHRRERVAGERGEAMVAAMTALSAGNRADATKSLDTLAAGGGAGYAPLARLLLADQAVQEGKTADAAKAFMAIADDGAAPRPLRDLALVRGTAVAFDTLPPATVVERLRPLAVAGNAWFGSAGEMSAIAQMRLGRTKAAGVLLAAVAKDATVPSSIRERVSQLAGDLGIEAVQPGDSGQP